MMESQVLTQLWKLKHRITALNGHLWYLTEEPIPFALGFNQLAPERIPCFPAVVLISRK